MAFFPRPASPRALWRDIRSFVAARQRHEIIFGFLAIFITAMIVLGFYVDSRVAPPPPTVTYVQSWPENRSDAEIIAQQKIDQKKKEERLAKRRAEYQRLAKTLGIDVDD